MNAIVRASYAIDRAKRDWCDPYWAIHFPFTPGDL
jgi:hypothetical protein